jgi:hypothetical protein
MNCELYGLGSTKMRIASTNDSNLLMAHILSNKMVREGYRVPVTQLSICNQNYAARFKSPWATDLGSPITGADDRQRQSLLPPMIRVTDH